MKSVKILTILSVLFLSVALFAKSNMANADKTDIEQAITNYVKSVDSQNVNDLSKTLLANGSVITLNNVTKTLDNYSGSQFISLVKNGQKGGWVRNVAVNSIDTDGKTAIAKVDISDARLEQSGFFTLVKENGVWKVASEVTTLDLKK